MAEQDFRGGLSLAEKRGEERGRATGFDEGRLAEARAAIADICDVLGIELTAERRAQLEGLALPALSSLRQQIKIRRVWPEEHGGTVSAIRDDLGGGGDRKGPV